MYRDYFNKNKEKECIKLKSTPLKIIIESWTYNILMSTNDIYSRLHFKQKLFNASDKKYVYIYVHIYVHMHIHVYIYIIRTHISPKSIICLNLKLGLSLKPNQTNKKNLLENKPPRNCPTFSLVMIK